LPKIAVFIEEIYMVLIVFWSFQLIWNLLFVQSLHLGVISDNLFQIIFHELFLLCVFQLLNSADEIYRYDDVCGVFIFSSV